ncbi:glycogen synthase GlgA [Rhodoblastus acidophilus]|uniref:Glycogen synthase n=1 Tax=Candidatus Rhodoblastus alkanivorans TaxID=2954117 RepID=A0ABS9Z7Y4_9HYPH|nr:glycogen synthase GlgA [Candidatus Rhodoblastus alkanivorans]MCI4678714.1 glycogen synthase GlgA [Candidatus Rhodoblastus alkanivorans]MCI4683490.1 glycogen synthase GlgA [Candidatus Rhodoblastus alkanivorans]MDI4640804.1 glycogen synthase GlgA [Rhodoblastus acidophilus]
MKSVTALSVAPEIYPLIKTGGLADVAGALPGALAAEHVALRTLCPGYRPVLAALKKAEAVAHFDDLFGGPARLLAARAAGLDLFALDAPHLYDRDGGPYGGHDGRDFPDNALRFAALAKVGALLGQGLVEGFAPQVVHAHDWQAGLTAAYLHYSGKPRPGAVMTAHNLAFQGQFPAEIFGALGLPPQAFSIEGVEYYGGVGFLKAGLQLSDRITTVSPTYAQEIQQGHSGMGLDGLLRARAEQLAGVLNGIDVEVWNPETDPMIVAPFTRKKIAARAENKKALQARMGLAHAPDRLLVGVVSRLSWQKGLDLLLACLPFFEEHNAQLVLLGTGDPALEAAFQEAAQLHPGRIGVHFSYDERLAHLIQAGADAILIPSRFEPCGLTQLCAMRYGAVPVAARVGGLADTIIDANEMALQAKCATGLQFAPVTAEALAGALRRCAALHARKTAWKNIQFNGLKTDVSWTNPARHYAEIYREVAPA